MVPKPMRILVADDEPDLLELLRINLEAQGHEVQLAADGTEALALAMARRPDLVILDVMMPGLDGLEVLRTLRGQPGNADLAVVLLSARGSDREVFEGWSSGANYYITKPFEIDELLSFIEQIWAQSRGGDEALLDIDIAASLDATSEEDVPPPVSLTSEQHHQLEIDLQDALASHQFFLVFQPSFDLRNLSVTGIEALIRWRHPIWGTLQPADFIPRLEETGLMVEVGRWVLRDACRQAAMWRREGYQLTVSVNISAGQLESEALVDHVEDALTQSGLDRRSLMIDVPETALVSVAATVTGRLTSLKELGVRIAIDDFGVGDLSLASLIELPVDTLKIHRSFMSEITVSTESADLMRSLVQAGKTLGFATLAKGIEQQEQLLQLQRGDCDAGQGFLFGPSLDIQAVGRLLDTWAAREVGLVGESGVATLPAFGTAITPR
jgi:EAL domain-containing protein (putative c-di-GMP-specific phosphodiesterase class I)/DNA-binding NarL/FixJ family response regulator